MYCGIAAVHSSQNEKKIHKTLWENGHVPSFFKLAKLYHLQPIVNCEGEAVQGFLINLEISIYALNNVISRLSKIMNRADKNWAQF